MTCLTTKISKIGIVQYSIVLVNLDATMRRELQKARPCVILSPNEMNEFLNTILISSTASSLKEYPPRIPVRHNKRKGMLVVY